MLVGRGASFPQISLCLVREVGFYFLGFGKDFFAREPRDKGGSTFVLIK